MNFKRIKLWVGLFSVLGTALWTKYSYAKVYLTPDQASKIMLGEHYSLQAIEKLEIVLTREQMKSIQRHSSVRVRDAKMNVWRTREGDWFILDNVIGKHENIDIAVVISAQGKVKNVEVLAYRETYGYEVMNKKWLAQFKDRDHGAVLKLDQHIQNISGATLSCRHITDGVNRLLHTWNQVLSRI